MNMTKEKEVLDNLKEFLYLEITERRDYSASKMCEVILQYIEKQTETPLAYEFHNYKTGHCYVDYIPRFAMDEMDGYTKIPLYK